MDNVFEILIYLFIIYAFLSSLFRKKKKPQSPPQPSPEEREIRTPSAKTSATEDYDILKEIESFFKIPGEETESRSRRTEEQKVETASEYFETTDLSKKTQPEYKPTLIQSQDQYENWEAKRKRIEEGYRKKVNDKVLKQAEMFEKHLAAKQTYAVDIKRIADNKFKDPASLKEYIVISEILGKPKAFAKESFGQE
jgi:hypothetical protein